jgi:ribonucleoside-diphosphate reductase alpha chain
LQGVTTNSLSKTINMPSKSTVEDVYNAFMMAWETGCKGTTVYVQNSRSDQVLSSETNDSLCYELDNITPISRSILGETAGTTIDKRSACGKMFITINRDKHGNIVESFVNVGKTGICKSNIDGINRLLSLALRSGIKVDEIVDQLMGIVCQGCVKAKAKDGKIDGNSCPDIIAKVLKEKYYATLKDDTKNETANGNFKCPECGELTLSKYDGCVHCTNCTYQKCS